MKPAFGFGPTGNISERNEIFSSIPTDFPTGLADQNGLTQNLITECFVVVIVVGFFFF